MDFQTLSIFAQTASAVFVTVSAIMGAIFWSHRKLSIEIKEIRHDLKHQGERTDRLIFETGNRFDAMIARIDANGTRIDAHGDRIDNMYEIIMKMLENKQK